MTWLFNPRRPGDPIQGFNDNNINNFGKESISSLVRESIQNSLDAQFDNSKPVEVHFETIQLDKNFLPEINEIEQHLIGCKQKAEDDVNEKREIDRHLNAIENRYYTTLLVKDFNTTGMTTTTLDMFANGSGKSYKKSSTAGGSKGVGKASFYALSYLRSVAIITKNEQGQLLAEISARISTHVNPKNPSEDSIHLGSYQLDPQSDFHQLPNQLQRNEMGSTIGVIGLWNFPHLKQDIIREVVRNYWFSIRDQKLVVEVENERICSDNIGNYINSYFQDYKDYNSGTKQNPKMYYETLNLGELFVKEIPELGECKLWIHHNAEYNENFVARFRQSRMLIDKKKELQPGYAAVFLCDTDEGNEFLRDLENDQHNEWKASNTHGDQKAAKDVLKEISNFVVESFSKIAKNKVESKFSVSALNDLFQFSKGKIITSNKYKTPKNPITNKKEEEKNDRLIKRSIVSVRDAGDDEFRYNIEFETNIEVWEQAFKIQVGTDSSKDYVEIISIADCPNLIEFKNDIIKMRVDQGVNYINGIELNTPFLTVPYIQSI